MTDRTLARRRALVRRALVRRVLAGEDLSEWEVAENFFGFTLTERPHGRCCKVSLAFAAVSFKASWDAKAVEASFKVPARLLASAVRFVLRSGRTNPRAFERWLHAQAFRLIQAPPDEAA